MHCASCLASYLEGQLGFCTVVGGGGGEAGNDPGLGVPRTLTTSMACLVLPLQIDTATRLRPESAAVCCIGSGGPDPSSGS
jgi:hypothetical protein